MQVCLSEARPGQLLMRSRQFSAARICADAKWGLFVKLEGLIKNSAVSSRISKLNLKTATKTAAKFWKMRRRIIAREDRHRVWEPRQVLNRQIR
jgi:hypothetical protein